MFTELAAWTAAHFPTLSAAFHSSVTYLASFPCSSEACVDWYQEGDLFYVRSTRRVGATPIAFDADEVVKFFREAKAGDWDRIAAAAEAALAKRSLV